MEKTSCNREPKELFILGIQNGQIKNNMIIYN